MMLEEMKDKARCCISGDLLTDSGTVNLVAISYYPEWKFPIMGNVLDNRPDQAVAIVHDKCINQKGHLTGQILFAVEFRDEEVIYHPIEELKPIEKS